METYLINYQSYKIFFNKSKKYSNGIKWFQIWLGMYDYSIINECKI